MAIGAIGGIVPPTAITQPVAPAATAPTGAPGGVNFASLLDSAAQTGVQADEMAKQLSTGNLQNIQQFTAAATKAELTVDLVVALRNRAVDAYQEIMRMSV
jgi:flagellar hook-basal body complex protein FliE